MIKNYRQKIYDELIFQRGKLNSNKLYNSSQVESKQPFFIVSAGRSGTTLLRKLLMFGGYVHIPPESDDNIPVIIKLYINNFKNLSWEDLVIKCINVFQKSKCFRFWHVDLKMNIHKLLNLEKYNQTLFSIIGYIYNEHRIAYNPNCEIWADKTPFLVYYIKWIHLLYPNSKIIHMVRDGRDFVASYLQMKNCSIDVALKRWQSSIVAIKNFSRKKDIILEVKYEDLVLNTRNTMSEICLFLDIPYNEEMFKTKDLKLGDDILDHHEGIKNKIHERSIGRCKTDLSQDQIKYIENMIGDRLADLGY